MPANGAQQRAQPPACSFTLDIPSTGPVHSRDNCAATRHGTALAYQVDHCRCTAARVDQARYRKQLRWRHHRGYATTIDATGTHRRIHALMAIGWPRHRLLARLGYKDNGSWLTRATKTTVHVRTAAAVQRLYDELSDTPGPSKWTRTWAVNRGYLAPLWWDDDTIDDPDHQPAQREQLTKHDIDPVAVDRACTGQQIRLTIAERHTAVAQLAASGHNNTQIADLLHSSRGAIQQIRARHRPHPVATDTKQEATG